MPLPLKVLGALRYISGVDCARSPLAATDVAQRLSSLLLLVPVNGTTDGSRHDAAVVLHNLSAVSVIRPQLCNIATATALDSLLAPPVAAHIALPALGALLNLAALEGFRLMLPQVGLLPHLVALMAWDGDHAVAERAMQVAVHLASSKALRWQLCDAGVVPLLVGKLRLTVGWFGSMCVRRASTCICQPHALRAR